MQSSQQPATPRHSPQRAPRLLLAATTALNVALELFPRCHREGVAHSLSQSAYTAERITQINFAALAARTPAGCLFPLRPKPYLPASHGRELARPCTHCLC
ncbi:hypothetical protein CC86DRAFT_106565 [Ophiobolus disseminans]|uniref:Uncharacterized protein n=1 Tax=Ophiobolus disseminans TaxID=1469910 RepID=A0A6A6ZMY1_9PLEO|nr:hypothetical protein CC86DRAFT_106565 [Ophiobolus disseminans]